MFSLILAFNTQFIQIQKASASEFEILTYGLLQLGHDDNRCSIAKIHSLTKDEDGEYYYQHGMGWFILTKNGVGIITPYHVITNSSVVFAECFGNLFELSVHKIDAEKDLAFLTTKSNDRTKLSELIFPVLMEITPGQLKYRERLNEKARWSFSVVSPEIPITEYKNNMRALALSMSSFGVVSAPDLFDRASSLILSPDFDFSVEPIVDDKDPFVKNLIRLDGLGIKPGLSGSALFGVIADQRLIHTDYKNDKLSKHYSLSVQYMPKILLGMVTKTRLNGSETVAVSIADVLDFMQEYDDNKNRNLELNVSYHAYKTKSGLELIPSLSIDRVPFIEYCADTYKNSGSLTKFSVKPAISTGQKQQTDVGVSSGTILQQPILHNSVHHFFQEYIRKNEKILPTSRRNEEIRINEHINMKKIGGGGDYGEGGNGFASQSAQFFLSSFPAFKLKGIDGFENIKQYQTQGIYKTNRKCEQEGLLFENKLITHVSLPNNDPQRLMTFEDLKTFYQSYGHQSLELIRKYSSSEYTWIYAKHKDLKDKSLEIPLLSASIDIRHSSKSISTSRFYQEKFLPASQKSTSVSSFLAINNLGFSVFLKNENMNFSLNLSNKNWSGNLEFSPACSIKLNSNNFKVINSWKAVYTDTNIDFNISLGGMKEFARININRIEGCHDSENLILGQFIIYGYAATAPVIGSTRTAIIPLQMDIEKLKTKFELGR